jgi:hypothetical protein
MRLDHLQRESGGNAGVKRRPPVPASAAVAIQWVEVTPRTCLRSRVTERSGLMLLMGPMLRW